MTIKLMTIIIEILMRSDGDHDEVLAAINRILEESEGYDPTRPEIQNTWW